MNNTSSIIKSKQFLVLFILFHALSYGQKVIDNPDLGLNNYPGDIIKVELLEDKTTIHFSLKGKPGKVLPAHSQAYISDVATGQKLHVVNSTGIFLNKKNEIPEEGVMQYALHFPKLHKTVKAIDFKSSEDTKKSLYILGLSLKPDGFMSKTTEDWLNTSVSKPAIPPLKDYDQKGFFRSEKGRIVGYIKGYSPRLGIKTGIINFKNELTGEDAPVVVPIKENGTFEVELPLIQPISFYIAFEKLAIVRGYLEPGHTLGVVVGDKNTFKGDLADIAKGLSEFRLIRMRNKSYKKHLMTLTPEEFKKRQFDIYKRNASKIEEYLKAHNISPDAKLAVLLENKNKLSNAKMLFGFDNNRARALRKDSTNAILKVKPKDTYYDFIQDINFNDKSFLVLDNFSSFINKFEFSVLFTKHYKQNVIKPKKTFYEYLEENRITISENDKKLEKVLSTKKIISKKEYDAYMSQLSGVYKDHRKRYRAAHIVPLYKGELKKKWELRDSILKYKFKKDKGLIYDITKVRALNFDLKKVGTTQDAWNYWGHLKTQIANDFLKQEGQRLVTKAYPKLNKELNSSNATSSKTYVLKEGKGKSIFDSIIAPYKGKIVFLDFWATSCGPCVAGIKRMKPIREKYANQSEFDFVYLTDTSSPEKQYDSFVEAQNLKNTVRLSKDDFNYLRQLFKFNGIPHYAVIDKKGNVIDNAFPMHNFETRIDEILTANK